MSQVDLELGGPARGILELGIIPMQKDQTLPIICIDCRHLVSQ